MNTEQNNTNRRRSQSGAAPSSRPLTPSRRVSQNSAAKAQPQHPAKKAEPHYPSSGRPSSASKASHKPKQDDYIDEPESSSGSTAISSLVKAIIYIMSILVVSGFLSYFVITVGNDVFAFVKSDKEIEITIGEGTTIKQLGQILEENGVIKSAKIFDFYAKLRNKNPALVAGDYVVSPSMNYDQLIKVFAKTFSTKAETVVVVIPEGYTVKDIVNTLVYKYNLSSEEELYDVIENYKFNYWFVEQLDENIRPDRMYRLEGYLYPDTYYYYTNASAITIINKMLQNFDVKMKQTFKNCTAPGNDYIEKINNLCKARNKTFDEIVILASMIQKEAVYDIEYGTISSVFNNRLNNPGREMNGKLESDATIYYFLDEKPKDLTQEHLQIDHPYNTRIYKGLPPGPISNPTFLAINYAFYPENTTYFYFVAKPDGYSLFGRTLAEHNKNVQTAREMAAGN